MAGNWFYEAIFLKISSAMHSGRECPCYVRKILGFYDWLLEAVFWQPMQDFGRAHINYRRLHEILTCGGGVKSAVSPHKLLFFFKICPHPCTGTITAATQVSHKIGPRTLSKVESKNLDLDFKCFRIIVPG